MLHAQFHGNRPAGSREEDFWRVFTIYGRGGHLGHVTQMPRTNFRSPYPSRLHIYLALIGQAVSEKKMFEIVDDGRTTDDGQTPDHGYTISSPSEPKGSGELKICFLYMRKQRCRSASQLISAFSFASLIVQILYFLNPKVLAFSLILSLYSLLFVRPCLRPWWQIFSWKEKLRSALVFNHSDQSWLCMEWVGLYLSSCVKSRLIRQGRYPIYRWFLWLCGPVWHTYTCIHVPYNHTSCR